jgi:hypothetical protein
MRCPSEAHRPPRRASSRRGVLALGAGTVLSACTIISPPPVGILRVTCDPPGATLWIDDVYMGKAADFARGKPVRAGFHRVELRYPDRYNHFAEVDVPENGEAEVTALLHPHLE